LVKRIFPSKYDSIKEFEILNNRFDNLYLAESSINSFADVSNIESGMGIIKIVLFLMALNTLFIVDFNHAEHVGRLKIDESRNTFWKDSMKLRIIIGRKTLTASLLKNKTAEDFSKLLPLSLTMNDLFGREKFGQLPQSISVDGIRSFTYKLGDIAYWSPSHDLAIYYKNDGESIPEPGIIIIGKIDSNLEVLNVYGSVAIKILKSE